MYAKEDAPKLCAADLKYSRMLQWKRLKANGAAVQVAYEPDAPPVSGVSWKMDADARYITRLPFTYVNTRKYSTPIRRDQGEALSLLFYRIQH